MVVPYAGGMVVPYIPPTIDQFWRSAPLVVFLRGTIFWCLVRTTTDTMCDRRNMEGAREGGTTAWYGGMV